MLFYPFVLLLFYTYIYITIVVLYMCFTIVVLHVCFTIVVLHVFTSVVLYMCFTIVVLLPLKFNLLFFLLHLYKPPLTFFTNFHASANVIKYNL